MSDLPPQLQPSDHGDPMEALLHRAAQRYDYPATPDIAGSVRQHIQGKRGHQGWPPGCVLRGALLILLIVLISIIAVPQVRAFVLEILRIGSITVVRTTPTPTITATLDPTLTRTPRPTPTLTPTPLTSALALPGETTLDALQAHLGFTIPLPAYPSDLGPPDRVFQTMDGGVLVTLVWLPESPPQDTDTVRLVFEILDTNVFGTKQYPGGALQSVMVNGHNGAWLVNVHQIIYSGNSGQQFVRLIDANVLLWQQGKYTYRLETKLPLEEALKIAESLR